MEQKQWKYKISSGKGPVVISFVMLAIFGGLAIWLHSAQNGAFIFAGLLAAVMLAVFFVTVYRFLFYKVLIGKEEFFYQTGAGNGRLYKYAEIEKAWISSGTAQNGARQEYCNISLPDDSVIRFPFYYADSEGVEYLVKRVETSDKSSAVTKERRDYIIDGKVYGKSRIVIGFVLLAIAVVIDAVIIKADGFTYLLVPSTALAVAAVWLLVVRYLYFKVQIGENGFYYRTNPFNGRNYEYSEITSCREIKKIIRHRAVGRNGETVYFFYFEFTNMKGKTQKFQFDKPVHEHEVNVLKERIETAKNRGN